MPTNFLQSLTGKLAENWIANLLTPAFIFWAGGLGAWVWRFGWKDLENWFTSLSEPIKYVVLVASLLIVTTSAVVIQRFDLGVIRLLEGYWPRWLNPLRHWLAQRQLTQQRRISWRLQFLKRKNRVGLTAKELARYWESYWPFWLQPLRRYFSPNRYALVSHSEVSSRKNTPLQRWLIRPRQYRLVTEQREYLRQLKQRFQVLKRKHAETGAMTALTFDQWNEYETLRVFWQEYKKRQKGLTPQEGNDYATLEWQLKQFPSRPENMMPTRLGNLLRAAENRPLAKYGLDPIICWPSFWLVLPDSAKKELQEARAYLDNAARFWLWSLLFTIWAIWAWWAAPVGLLSALFTYYWWILGAAATYGDLLEAAFDTHRIALYKSLRWKLPSQPKGEDKYGEEITRYLWRGPDELMPDFFDPPPK
ncbi:MAG: hypothetical protein ACAF41_02485 [Leptolyngbya sp. BL-A-14]